MEKHDIELHRTGTNII